MARARSNGYLEQEQDLVLALLDEHAAALDCELERIANASFSGVGRVKRFAQATLARADDAARVQVRAGLPAGLVTEDTVRAQLAQATQRRRELVRLWIEEGVGSGGLVEIPPNEPASILLALTDDLMPHGAPDPGAVSQAQHPPGDPRAALRKRNRVRSAT